MNHVTINRRSFLRAGALAAGGTFLGGTNGITAVIEAARPSAAARSGSKVAIVGCKTYGPEVREAFQKSFELLGGIGSLVRGKTVTVKINLTGTDFSPYLDRPVGETYMTHFATVAALAATLFDAGARRVRFVESTNSRAKLETTLGLADWDLKALQALGNVEFENTRNLGTGKNYSHFKVPGGGRMFSSFDLNHSYEETDVMVSLAKLKQHVTAGVTLTMKNLFGITPNSLYGDEAGDEGAIAGRGVLHSPRADERSRLPGMKADAPRSTDPMFRVPHIVADICAARPIDLAIIDGITSMTGGEGPWCGGVVRLRYVQPGVLIVGLNPVSTDAVGTAVMGYTDPRAPRGKAPFATCENHLALADQAGIGTADLAKIDLRGLAVSDVRFPFESATTPR